MITLECSMKDYELVHKQANARSRAKTLPIDKKALRCLLVDHSRLLGELERARMEVEWVR